jgi:alpha-tubulin suppressor-like RCC1 family protein
MGNVPNPEHDPIFFHFEMIKAMELLKGRHSIVKYARGPISSTSFPNVYVYSKGVGVYGCLGHGDDLHDKLAYTRIKAFDHQHIKAINAAMGHSAVVSSSGELQIFGRPYEIDNLLRINRFRVVSPTLARFVNRTSASSLFGDLYLEPTSITDFMEPVKYLRSIGGFNIILMDSGRLYTMGSNRWESNTLSFQRYRLDAESLVKNPVLVSLPMIKEADVGLQHCIACSVDGKVYTWGAGERGQLGDGRFITDTKPVLVRLPDDQRAVDVRTGFHFSCALTEDGRVYVWGKYMSTVPKNSAISSGMIGIALLPLARLFLT